MFLPSDLYTLSRISLLIEITFWRLVTFYIISYVGQKKMNAVFFLPS